MTANQNEKEVKTSQATELVQCTTSLCFCNFHPNWKKLYASMANVVLGGHAETPSSIASAAQRKSPRFRSRAKSPQEQQTGVKATAEQLQQLRALSNGSTGAAAEAKPSKTSQSKRAERSLSARASTPAKQDSGSDTRSSSATRSTSDTRVKKLWKDIKEAPADAAPVTPPKDKRNKTPTKQRSQGSKPSSSFCSYG